MSSTLQADPPIESPPFPVARFSVEQYHRMVASGAFTEDDRIELLDGWVVEKMPKGPAHELVIAVLAELLRSILPPGWQVRNQAPITLANSEPEPDLTVVRGVPRDYRERHPHGNEVGLVVEVADTSLSIDRRKARLYASAGIAEYWIVNISDRCIEVYRQPEAAGYRDASARRDGEEVELVVNGQTCGAISVAECLP